MGRFAAILLAVSGTVALPVVAQAVLQVSVRFIGRRTRGATELRRTFWIRSAPWCRCCSAIWHRWDCGLGSSSCSAHSRPTTMLYFSLVTFATLGYGDIVLTPGYRIFVRCRLVDRADLRRHQPCRRQRSGLRDPRTRRVLPTPPMW